MFASVQAFSIIDFIRLKTIEKIVDAVFRAKSSDPLFFKQGIKLTTKYIIQQLTTIINHIVIYVSSRIYTATDEETVQDHR